MLTDDSEQANPMSRGQRSAPPAMAVSGDNAVLVCRLSGDWTTRTAREADELASALESRSDITSLQLDLAAVEKIDTAGAWLVERMAAKLSAQGAAVTLTGHEGAVAILVDAVRTAVEGRETPGEKRRTPLLLRFPEAVGRMMYESLGDFLAAMNILGATIRGAQMKFGRGHAVNPAAIFNQIDRIGVGAIPVVLLMSFIVGAIVAQQGAFQLRYFGAEIFVVDLVGILVLRELGVLMTAIMLAGRSGSAITAEIGSMKMHEEVDALKVIGLNPIGVLVFPRLVALVVSLPCLAILANFAALAGAIGIAWVYSGIEPDAFIDRLRTSVDVSTILAGMIKAPFMAMIIGIIASVEGLKVGGSAESLGQHVTASVVKAIFVVIIIDGLFAIFYAQIDF